MKTLFAIAAVCLVSLSVATGQSAPTVEDQIKRLEEDWAKASVRGDMAAVDFEADDFIGTDPAGQVSDKAQERRDLASGDLKFQSQELSDLRVRVYGDAAVATGANTLKGTYKGQEFG